jgi:hypothetical protein
VAGLFCFARASSGLPASVRPMTALRAPGRGFIPSACLCTPPARGTRRCRYWQGGGHRARIAACQCFALPLPLPRPVHGQVGLARHKLQVPELLPTGAPSSRVPALRRTVARRLSPRCFRVHPFFLGPPSHLCTLPNRQTIPVGVHYVIVDLQILRTRFGTSDYRETHVAEGKQSGRLLSSWPTRWSATTSLTDFAPPLR